MSGSISQQLELIRQQRSKVSINRYQFKELQSLVPKCWSNVRLLHKNFEKCSELFYIPDEIPFNSNGIHDNPLPAKIDLMNQNQLKKLDNLVTCFLDLSLPFNTRKDVQTLVWYLIYSYQANSRYSTNLMLYILPRQLSNFYLEILQHLIFPKDSTLKAYKTNKNPSREYITEATIKYFNNYQLLSSLVRRLCIDLDMDEENSELMAFYNSIQIELFNQSGGIPDNQLRFFIANALQALKYPKRRNYYTTYLCGLSALVVKVNLSSEIQNEIINTLIGDEIDTDLQEIIILISTILKHQNNTCKLPNKWISSLINNNENQQSLFNSIVELIESEMEPLRFCELLTKTVLNSIQSDDLIDKYVIFIINLIKHTSLINVSNNVSSVVILTILLKLENISIKVNGPLLTEIDGKIEFYYECKNQLLLIHKILKNVSMQFPNIYNILIKSPVNSNEYYKNFLSKSSVEFTIDSELELDSFIQYIANISIFDSKKSINLILLSLEKFQYWTGSNIYEDKLSLLAHKIISVLPLHRSDILNCPSLWQFVSRLDNRADYIPTIYNILMGIMREVDEYAIQCLYSGLVTADKYQLFANDYILLEYCLTNIESSQDLFTCLDILIQLGVDYPNIGYLLGPIFTILIKLNSNKNLNGRLKSYLSCTLNSLKISFNWSEMPINCIETLLYPVEFNTNTPILSIHILIEYLDFLSNNCIDNSSKIIRVLSLLFHQLDKVLRLSGISSNVDKIPLISTLVNYYTNFTRQFLSQIKILTNVSQNWIVYNILTLGCTIDILHNPLCKIIKQFDLTFYGLNMLNCYFKLGFVDQTLYKLEDSNSSEFESSSLSIDINDFIENKNESILNINENIFCPCRFIKSNTSPLVLYNRLLKLFNMSGKDSSLSILILLIYLTPFMTNNTFIESTLERIRFINESKSSIDLLSTMDKLVKDGFLISNPLINYNISKSSLNDFISSLMNEKNINIVSNYTTVMKGLMAKYPRILQNVIYISHFLPPNILRNSMQFYTLLQIRKCPSNTIHLYSDIVSNKLDMRKLAIILNILRIKGLLLLDKCKDRKFINNYVKFIILPLSSINKDDIFITENIEKILIYIINNQIIKYNFIQYLEDSLIDVILLLGKNYFHDFINIDKTFKILLNLIVSDNLQAYQIANTLITMSDYVTSSALLPDVLSKLSFTKGDLKISLFLISCKIAIKYPEQIEKLSNKLIELGIDFWWIDSLKFSTEMSIIFLNLSIQLAKMYTKVSDYILKNWNKLTNPFLLNYKSLITDLVKTTLSSTRVDDKVSKREKEMKLSSLIWENTPENTIIDFTTDTKFTPLDYYLFSVNVIKTGTINHTIYDLLDEVDKILIILSMSYLYNVINDNESKFDILSELIATNANLLQISTAVQSDKGTFSYNKIGYIGDLLYNLLKLNSKYQLQSLKKSIKLIISKTHLMLNTPHLILAILDYPYYYDPTEMAIMYTKSIDDIPVILELFKVLTNTFNTPSNPSEGLKGLEISFLYYKISHLLSSIYEHNPHIALKSLIFLIKLKCSDCKILRTVIYPMVINNEKTLDLPKNDIYLLCKLINLSTLIPRIDSVLVELGSSLIKVLIKFNSKLNFDLIICTTISNIINFVKINNDLLNDLFGICFFAPNVLRNNILTGISKSITIDTLNELLGLNELIGLNSIENCTVESNTCKFNLIESFIHYYNGEITVYNNQITQFVIKLIINCKEFDSINQYPLINSINLTDYINQFNNYDLLYAKYINNLTKLLIKWFNKTTLFEMINFLEKLRVICDKKQQEIHHYNHLYLYILSNILLHFKDFKLDSMVLPLTISIINNAFKSIKSNNNINELNYSILTLSLLVLAFIKEFIKSGQIIPDLINCLANSISIIELFNNKNNKRKRKIDEKIQFNLNQLFNTIEEVLVNLLTIDSYEASCKGISKQLSIGDNFTKITLLSSLFNVWSRNIESDPVLVDRLGVASRELNPIIKDYEFDPDLQVSTIAKKLRKKLEEFSFRINEVDIE